VARSRNYIIVQNESRFEVSAKDGQPGARGHRGGAVPVTELPILLGHAGRRHPGGVALAWRRMSVTLDLTAHAGQDIQRDVVELMDAVVVSRRPAGP